LFFRALPDQTIKDEVGKEQITAMSYVNIEGNFETSLVIRKAL